MAAAKHSNVAALSPGAAALLVPAGGPARKRARALPLAREVLLTTGAVLGLLCLIGALAAVVFGITPIVFRSGSMGPTIDTGALALSRPVAVADISIHDVVSVSNAQGERVTHRVVAVAPAQSGNIMMTLKGDANALADPQPYPVPQNSKVDLIFFSTNGLGYAVAFLQSPWAIFTGGLLAGVLVFIAVKPQKSRERATNRRSGRRVAALLAVVVLPLAGLSFSGSSQGTLASFTDSSVATGGTLRAARLMDITGGIQCTDSFPNSTITWNPAPFLPPEGSYALKVTRLKANGTIDQEMGYFSTAAGITTFTFTPSGALLGLLSGPTTFRISIFSVITTGGLASSDGSNILWSSSALTVGNRNILNYPGLLIGLGAHTQCDPS